MMNQNTEQSDPKDTPSLSSRTQTTPGTTTDETRMDKPGRSGSQAEKSGNHLDNNDIILVYEDQSSRPDTQSEQSLRKEITELGLEMAKLSDSSKNTDLKDNERKEILEAVNQLEKKKDDLTKLLPDYDPVIASKFRTSTPENMETETINPRKRNSSILNRSFSDPDLRINSRNQKPRIIDSSQKKILSFFSKQTNSNEQLKDGEETTEEEDDSWKITGSRGRGRGRNRAIRTGKEKPTYSRTPTPKQNPSKPKREVKNTSIPNLNTKPTSTQTQQNTSNACNSSEQPINPETLFSSQKSDETNEEANNQKPGNDNEDKTQSLWEKYIKAHPTPDANALRRHFQKIYTFLEDHFISQQQIIKSDDKPVSQMSKDIQELIRHQSESQKKQQETMDELKAIKKILEKNNQTVQQSIKQIDKTMQQGVKNKEEYPALQPYAEKLKKNLQCIQIAKKNENIFNFELILKGERRALKKEEDNIIQFLMDKSKSFQNSKINSIRFANEGATIQISSISTEKESLKTGLQKAINEVTKEQVDVSIRKSSEVMKIAALNASFSDEQIHGMIEENLNNPQFNREYIKENVRIFRRITSRFDTSKMTVFMRVTSPLLETINSKREFLPTRNHFRRVTITPIIYISNCTNCFGFHPTSKCEEKNLCKKCGSPDHKISECKGTTNCINCKRANRGKGTHDHLPTDKACPQLQREYERQTARCFREANPCILEELKQQNSNNLLTHITGIQYGQ
ncbi:uncharacterized protein [Bemisia tabaci]|uniref:uncharacterized protein n=1 Tax=Bemisia tabaci TaxID=7038 RepID=UPI003B27EC6C